MEEKSLLMFDDSAYLRKAQIEEINLRIDGVERKQDSLRKGLFARLGKVIKDLEEERYENKILRQELSRNGYVVNHKKSKIVQLDLEDYLTECQTN